ncbi:HNH endonuclease [Mycobacterium sp. PS03-16]|uniref:HNH endonuclease signature motif containing protein n=1 Tax=Mycobacterium sp. PS03-16 TaxID=2559611 RepID=UPI001073EF73|nr:HNH endonuclease signature motif containing protein [Mycobacterium sp. PS03-16]TFV60270.1 HNH endonuclease [Mycobacterium sp. PS03-16]
MSSTATVLLPQERLGLLFEEMSELCGQRNAIDGRLAEIVAEIDGAGLWGATGCRSIASLVAWKTGTSPSNAETMVAVAHRLEQFPRCAEALREGRLSLDQVGVIAKGAAEGSDEHYVELAQHATVTQLRTMVKLEPRPQPKPKPEPESWIAKHEDGDYTTWRIRLTTLEAAKFDAALQSHRDGLIADWKRDHDAEYDAHGVDARGRPPEQAPSFPTTVDAFMSLIEAGWDTDVARRPHGQRTTVLVHLDVDKPAAGVHLGPMLSDEDRAFLLCDATFQAWFERDGQPLGAGRSTRGINRRLRRALEHRDRCCVVPGCGATRGLHAHHIRHWQDGGPTDVDNLVLVCPYHHRLHHRGVITISGTAGRLTVTDDDGRPLRAGSLARPPTTPAPAVPPYAGPTGERMGWWWYRPFEPHPPPSTN